MKKKPEINAQREGRITHLEDEAQTARPRLFVASSTEGLKIAKALQQNLDSCCQVQLWAQGVFGLSSGTLTELVEKLPTFDFATLVLTADDLIVSRGVTASTPRDNVLLELGLCIGTLGTDRTFVVYDRSANIKLPSDLAGVTNASFHPHDDGNHQAAVGAASTKIEQAVQQLGVRTKHGQTGVIDEETQYRVIADLLGVVADNYLIQMFESGKSLVREPAGILSIAGNYWYGINFPGRYVGNGRFSVHEMCKKLVNADIISQDLESNVFLTLRGERFAEWLSRNNYRAPAFVSPLGKWGSLDKYTRDSLKYLKGDGRSPSRARKPRKLQ